MTFPLLGRFDHFHRWSDDRAWATANDAVTDGHEAVVAMTVR
jgi:hypothetical protein